MLLVEGTIVSGRTMGTDSPFGSQVNRALSEWPALGRPEKSHVPGHALDTRSPMCTLVGSRPTFDSNKTNRSGESELSACVATVSFHWEQLESGLVEGVFFAQMYHTMSHSGSKRQTS